MWFQTVSPVTTDTIEPVSGRGLVHASNARVILTPVYIATGLKA